VSAALTHSALHNLLVSGALYYTIWCSSYFEWHLDVIDLMCLNVIRRLYAVELQDLLDVYSLTGHVSAVVEGAVCCFQCLCCYIVMYVSKDVTLSPWHW